MRVIPGKLDNGGYNLNFRILTIFLAAALTVGILPAYAGPIIIGGDDLTDHGHNTGTTPLANGACTGTNIEGWLYIELAIKDLVDKSTRRAEIPFEFNLRSGRFSLVKPFKDLLTKCHRYKPERILMHRTRHLFEISKRIAFFERTFFPTIGVESSLGLS